MRQDRAGTDYALLALACAAGVALRVWLASRGHNFDMESWTMTADLVAGGQNVYANTYRHPYGPTWFMILGALRSAHDALGMHHLGPESFHIMIAAFLSLADVAIALLLYRALRLGAALFFILNPVSILITGYHSQIDTLAILPALAAWLLIGRAMSWRRLLISAALLGLSLSIKHVMIFFPIWLLMTPLILGRVARRIAHAAVTYGVLVAIVLPFVLAPGAWTGFREYVMSYEGLASNRTLLLHAIDLFAPPAAVDSLFGIIPQGVSTLYRLFIVLMLLVGYLVARCKPGEMLWCYLLAIVVLTNSMADQYLAVPLVACAAYWRRWAAWVYVIPATLLIYWAAAIDAGALPAPAPRWHPYVTRLSYPHAQVWLAILLIGALSRSRGWGGILARKDQVRTHVLDHRRAEAPDA